MNPSATIPSSVRSCPEPGLDPVEQIVPVVIYLIRVRTPGAVAAGGDPMNKPGKDDIFLILAGGIIFVKPLCVYQEIMGAHGRDEQRHCDILKRARCRIVAGTPVDLLIIKGIG